jgi:hypothetical protein
MFLLTRRKWPSQHRRQHVAGDASSDDRRNDWGKVSSGDRRNARGNASWDVRWNDRENTIRTRCGSDCRHTPDDAISDAPWRTVGEERLDTFGRTSRGSQTGKRTDGFHSVGAVFASASPRNFPHD